MSEPIKGCPQPDAPELVMRADGYHYQSEDEMSYRELTDKQVMAAAMDYQEANMSCYRAVIAADRALNAPADRGVMREALEAIVETHQGFCEHHIHVQAHSSELADIASRALAAAPSPPAEQQGEQEPVAAILAELRAKVEALHNVSHYDIWFKNQVLALIDKMGGEA